MQLDRDNDMDGEEAREARDDSAGAASRISCAPPAPSSLVPLDDAKSSVMVALSPVPAWCLALPFFAQPLGGSAEAPLLVDVSPPVPLTPAGRAVSHFSLHCPPPVYSSAAMASPDGWRYAVHAMERRKGLLFKVVFSETEVVSAGIHQLWTTMTTTTTATTKSNKNTPIPTAVVTGDDVSATRLALVTVLIKLLQRRAGAVDASAAANVEVLREHHPPPDSWDSSLLEADRSAIMQKR